MTRSIMRSYNGSQNGVGSCLMQNEKPIAYASKALTHTEQRWEQIEKRTIFSCIQL